MAQSVESVAAEVAATGAARSAAVVLVEVALTPPGRTVEVVVVEVAGTFPAPPPSTARRTATGNEVRFPW